MSGSIRDKGDKIASQALSARRDGTEGDAGASCVNIWASGATLITSNGTLIGGRGFYLDTLHDAPIQQANTNDTTVTLINSGDAGDHG
jgi:hypothetical protein